MSPPLFLVDELPHEAEFDLEGDEGRHALVHRLERDEVVLVGDGRGRVLTCRVRRTTSAGVRLVAEGQRSILRADPRLVVVQALPKGDRGELAVEVLTELGVDEIIPWAAARSITRWQGSRGDRALEKWRRTVREAVKQSRRAWAPDVADLHSTQEVAARLPGTTALVLHEEASRPLVSTALPTSGQVVVVVGPEGGVSPEELAAFATNGASAVRLGSPVLRTSTAGAAALAALSVRLGRWN